MEVVGGEYELQLVEYPLRGHVPYEVGVIPYGHECTVFYLKAQSRREAEYPEEAERIGSQVLLRGHPYDPAPYIVDTHEGVYHLPAVQGHGYGVYG